MILFQIPFLSHLFLIPYGNTLFVTKYKILQMARKINAPNNKIIIVKVIRESTFILSITASLPIKNKKLINSEPVNKFWDTKITY